MPLFDQPPLHDFPDRAFHQLLQDPANLRNLLAALLPDLVDRFDFAHLEVVPPTFLTADWRRRETDLLFRLPFLPPTEGERLPPVLVCILVEHQTDPDPAMPLRLLLYAVLFWEREWKAWEAGHTRSAPLRLTPILPIVFHTGLQRWRTSRTLAELVVGPEELAGYAPRWEPLFWEVVEHGADELLQAAGEFLATLAVVRAEGEEAEAFREVFRRVLERLAGLSDQERVRWYDLLWFVLSWGLRRRPMEESEALLTAAQESQTDVQWREELQRMGQRVQRTWDQEMLARGELRAYRENLRLWLEERFGTLPEALVQRIEAIEDAERLRAALRQVVHLNSLAELAL